jgi:hypothetical protein
MNNAIISYANNSRAICEPFVVDISRLQGNGERILGTIEADMRRRMLEQLELAISNRLVLPQPVDVQCIGSPSTVQVTRHAKNETAIRLLESWRHGDEQEQRETWECLKHALDEDRLSDRRLFP